MIVSSENVKKFLLDVIQQTSFPGHLVEFVASVKREVSSAKIELQENVKEIENTASSRMDSSRAK